MSLFYRGIFAVFCVAFFALPLRAAETESSLVDKVMQILGKDIPKIEVRPEAKSATPAGPAAPDETTLAIGQQFLPVISFGREVDETPPPLLPFFASAALQQNTSETLIVILPDADRDAARAFNGIKAVQDKADAAPSFIFAPQFLRGADLAPQASKWPDGGKAILRWAGNGWISGQDSVQSDDPTQISNKPSISSFAALDSALITLVRPSFFPKLKRVVITGLGAGAEFTQRYAVLGRAPDVLNEDGIEVRFVVTAPRSYLYMDARRVKPKPGHFYVTANEPVIFAEPKTEDCPANNLYPFGFDGLPPYAKGLNITEARMRYGARHVYYLVGAEAKEKITDPTPEACALALQGASLIERADNYFAGLQRFFGADIHRTQRLNIIPALGADAVNLWQSACGTAVLFGDGGCPPTN